jgi:hypothetical protein
VSVTTFGPTRMCPYSMYSVASLTVFARRRRTITTGSRRRQNFETLSLSQLFRLFFWFINPISNSFDRSSSVSSIRNVSVGPSFARHATSFVTYPHSLLYLIYSSLDLIWYRRTIAISRSLSGRQLKKLTFLRSFFS